MEETVIVVMLKNEETGFLEKEIGCYKITENENYIVNSYAKKQGDNFLICIKLSCDRGVADWEFNAIYDYYDIGVLENLSFVTEVTEEDDCYNPTWNVFFPFDVSESFIENCIEQLLATHKSELDSVYIEIKDKKNEYEKSESYE